MTDNQKKVTHGCIIATLHLVKDGMEMGRPVSTIDRTAAGRMGEGVSSKDCKELLKILSHALHREQEVETKLHNIDRVSISYGIRLKCVDYIYRVTLVSGSFIQLGGEI